MLIQTNLDRQDSIKREMKVFMNFGMEKNDQTLKNVMPGSYKTIISRKCVFLSL